MLSLLLLGSLFYWYEYRPSKFRKECYNELKEKVEKGNVSTQQADIYLKSCLMKHGIE